MALRLPHQVGQKLDLGGAPRFQPTELITPRHLAGKRQTHIGELAAVAGAYAAVAVHFDGTNDYGLRTSDLTSNTDTKVGIMSLWIDWTGGDGTNNQFVYMGQDGSAVFTSLGKHASNKMTFTGRPSGCNTMAFESTATFNAAAGWQHFMCAWNAATTVTQCYVDDVSGIASVTNTDSNLNNTVTNHVIGWNLGLEYAAVNIADFYINFQETMDLSSEVNRRKFIDDEGKPVDLGNDGSLPTGTAPIIYLSRQGGSAASFLTDNKGSGGDFAETGSLTDSTNGNPSD